MSATTLVRSALDDSWLTMSVSVVVTLTGDLDRSVADAVTNRIALAMHAADFTQIDARQLDFIDASGIRALLLSKQYALDRGTMLTVRYSRQGPVERLLKIVGLAT